MQCVQFLAERSHWLLQALEEDRLGPRRQPYSGERQRRLAVLEAATSLICTLMPAIEPVSLVSMPPLPPAN